jgi:hypothetical protein
MPHTERMLRMIRYALALVAGTALAAASHAQAAEINLGLLAPSTACVVSSRLADRGLICPGKETVSQGPDIFDVEGFSDKFTTESALTFKPETGNPITGPHNNLNESGFGDAGPE